MLTRCPACGTTYRVSPEQIRARQGKVRCGRCHTIFDALESLVDAGLQSPKTEPSWSAPRPEAESDPIVQAPMPPRPKAAAVPAESARSAATEPVATRIPGSPWTEPILPAGDLDALLAETQDITPSRWSPVPAEPAAPEVTTHEASATVADFDLPAPPPRVDTDRPFAAEPPLAALPAPDEPPDADAQEPARSLLRPILAGFVASLLLITLAVQAALHFRSELAVRHPGVRPLLQVLCDTLRCTIELPRLPDQIVLEGQALLADPARPNQLTLSATLGNRANIVQAFPHLELTLLSGTGRPLVRRVFAPSDYLTADTPMEKGFASGAELPVTIAFETKEVSATDYRIGAFFP